MPAGSTYTPIATTTLGSAQANYTFTSIPSTYTDLVLVTSGSISSSADRGLQFRVNGDTGTNYSWTYLDGDGSTASSGRQTGDTSGNAGLASTSTIVTSIAQFLNYSNTTTFKTVLSRGSNAGSRVRASVNLWRNTSAITSITIFDSAFNLNTGYTLTLYGIASA
jgi:hypothetical protein